MKLGFGWFIAGLLLAMGGVGGVEQSVSNMQLLQSTLLAVAGLGLMAVGVSYVKEYE